MMRRWMLLCLTLSATGCLERAYAQSAPRGDGGPPTDARVWITGPRENPDPDRERANLQALGALSGTMLANLLAANHDAGLEAIAPGPGVNTGQSIGDRGSDSFGRGGLGSTPAPPQQTSLTSSGQGTLGLGGMGRIAGTGSGSGGGHGWGGITLPTNARVLRDQLALRGDGLPVEVVRRVLRRHRLFLASCFERPFVPAPLEHATVVAQFELVHRPNTSPRVAVSSVEGAARATNACLRVRLSAIVFPQLETAAPLAVRYTLAY